jgi:CheY-like chemotaxis protein
MPKPFEQSDMLLVEDDSNNAEFTLRVLRKSNPGSKVFWVKDGPEALDYIFNTGAYAGYEPNYRLSLVLLDLKLPKIGGIEVLKRIKGDARFKTLPIVIVTSSQEMKDLEECYRLGVNSYLIKPIDADEYAAMIAGVGTYWMTFNKPLR